MRANKNNWWVDPLIVVACLLIAEVSFGQPLTPAVGYLALCAFAISALTLHLARGLAGADQAPAWILNGWAAAVVVLLFLAFALRIGAEFSRRVILTWFVIAPVALYVSTRLHGRRWLKL